MSAPGRAGGALPLSVYKKYQNETGCAVSFAARCREEERLAGTVSSLVQQRSGQRCVHKAGKVVLRSHDVMLQLVCTEPVFIFSELHVLPFVRLLVFVLCFFVVFF